jgi:DNA helicase-2/ATP-dependent DNA helicase PcrA
MKFDPRGEGEERRENVLEFIGASREFDVDFKRVMAERRGEAVPEERPGTFSAARTAALRALLGDADIDPPSALEAFLSQLAILGDADQGGSDDRVSLMTLHAAKGLEFDVVFMTGVEEGIFPSARSLDDPEAIEEERRLAYVGITRARRKLYVTLARQRALFGDLRFNAPSRFLLELPASACSGLELLGAQGAQRDRQGWDARDDDLFGVTRPRPRPAPRPEGEYVEREDVPLFGDDGPRRPPPRLVPPRISSAPREEQRSDYSRTESPKPSGGGRVRHATFGEGRVVARQGDGPNAKLTVMFPSVGAKVVVARFLETLE